MKATTLLIPLCSLLLSAAASAQWQTTTYSIKGGWSSIYLTGDAKQDTLENIFPAAVTEVWRWNPNPNAMQFTDSPLIPVQGTPEWSVWKRGDPLGSDFTQLTGGGAYLVKANGTASNTYSVAIKQSPLPPANAWVRNGANLMGFPTRRVLTIYPTFSKYFTTFPAAIAANSKIYRYVGGELGPSNPVQVFSTTTERVDRTQAYWFSAEVVENFFAPLDVRISSPGGLDFGRTGSIITVYVRNRADTVATLTVAPLASEAAPTGQTAIAGQVPVTRRVFNPSTLLWTETPITAAFDVPIAPGVTTELQFGINRGAITGTVDSLFASFLRLTDSGNNMDLVLPARAQKASLAGLWVGDIKLAAVESKISGDTAATTPEPFPLRTLLHVTTGGSATMLSQVFLGQLEAAPNNVGLCTREELLKQDAKAGAQRMVAAHLPLDQVIAGSGTVDLPGTVTCTVTIPFNDPTNPFVHQYHPDHDNKDARFRPVGAGVESYDITRTCSFTFTADPPEGSASATGWGSSILGGTYSEVISGASREPITVSGTFELRRASEIGTLAQ